MEVSAGHVAALVLPDQFQPVGRNTEGAGVGLHHLALLIQHFDGAGAQRVQGSAGDAAGQLHHHGLPGQARPMRSVVTVKPLSSTVYFPALIMVGSSLTRC